ncbi:class II aldolase/adducin family protein [Pseudomonas palleroniana]|uniref:class II aldolase/adducin family protein n=1 Tax=Pseudomonas palleroniana TaxID=191390 RepID=UPI0018E69245|nr:class II aldolase/adducin family protein [Pseudomonas palleroniana]MBI6906813.1 class II aldolase/adducin family protein [Pseudomonas palleroniana]
MALALRAADYYGIAGPTNARFSVSLPGQHDVLLMPTAQGWASAKAEDVVAVNSDGVRLDGAGDVDRKLVEAHFGMHAVSGRDWVLHVYSHHVVESVAGGLNNAVDTLVKLSRQGGERTVQNHRYGDAWMGSGAAGKAPSSKGGAEILLLAQSGISVCANTLKDAFEDLYHLERFILANYLLQAPNLEPSVVSGQISLLLCAQFEAHLSQSLCP